MTGPQTPDPSPLEDEGDVEEAAGVVDEAVARRNDDSEPYDEEEASPT